MYSITGGPSTIQRMVEVFVTLYIHAHNMVVGYLHFNTEIDVLICPVVRARTFNFGQELALDSTDSFP